MHTKFQNYFSCQMFIIIKFLGYGTFDNLEEKGRIIPYSPYDIIKVPIKWIFSTFKYLRRYPAGIMNAENKYTFENIILINKELIHHKLYA